MKMRACRKLRFPSCGLALEVRLSPAIVSPFGTAGMVPMGSIISLAVEDPLPDPEPAPAPRGVHPSRPPDRSAPARRDRAQPSPTRTVPYAPRGSTPFGHAAIVARDARRGSRGAHSFPDGENPCKTSGYGSHPLIMVSGARGTRTTGRRGRDDRGGSSPGDRGRGSGILMRAARSTMADP
jgi:hypothetical protein